MPRSRCPIRKLSATMRLMRRYRPVPAVVFAIAVSALVGGLFGRSALADRRQGSRTLQDVHRGAERHRGAATSTRSIPTASSTAPIRGMLGTLDPHSSFFDPKEYAQMRERQEGRYYGLGITIQAIDGDITAPSVFEGSPAYKKGIRRGDVIAKIDGEDAKGWTDRAGDAASCAARRARRSRSRSSAAATSSRFRSRSRATKSTIPTVPAALHDRRDDRLHPPSGLGREHRSRRCSARCAICARRA